jgi:hypothetical protein
MDVWDTLLGINLSNIPRTRATRLGLGPLWKG